MEYGKFAIERGLKQEMTNLEYGRFCEISALDENFRIVNQHLKFLKRGFGHVTDQVCEAIHLGKRPEKRL